MIFLSRVLAGALISVSLPTLALASEQERRDGDVIVVTAARFSQSTLEAPANVAIVTGTDLDTQGSLRLGDALTAKVPGLYMRGDLVSSTPRLGASAILSLRGQSQSRVKVLIDGRSLNDANSGGVNGLSGVLNGDVERIEVVPGIGSALYGSDAIGGVINIITKVPTEREVSGRFVKGFGDSEKAVGEIIIRDRLANNIGFMLGVNREVYQGFAGSDPVTIAVGTTGTGAVKATGGRLTTNNKGDPVYEIGHKGAVRSALTNVSTKIFVDMNANSRLTAGYQFNRTRSTVGKKGFETYLRGEDGNSLPFDVSNVSINGDKLGTLRETNFRQTSLPLVREEQKYFATYEGDFIGTVTSRLDIAYVERDYSYASAGTGATNIDGPGTQVSVPNTSFMAEGQLVLPQTGVHNIIIGASFNRSTLGRSVEQVKNWRSPDNSGTGTFNELVDGKSNSFSAYFQDKINATEALSIYLGARFDHWDTQGVAVKNTGTPTGTTRYKKRTSSALSPKISAVYRLDETLTLRSSLGLGFRAPSLFDLYSAPSSSSGRLLIPDPDLKPERAFAWDLGVEKSFASRGCVKAGLFYTRLEDMLYRKLTPYDGPLAGIDHYAINTNAGKAWVRGIELAASLPLSSWLQLNGSYSYTDSKLFRDETGTGLYGTKLRYVPDHLVSASLNANLNGFSAYLGASYTGNQFSSEDNSDVVKNVPGGYSKFLVANARVQYQLLDTVKLGASLNNVTNKKYYEFYRAPGRNFSMDVSFRF